MFLRIVLVGNKSKMDRAQLISSSEHLIPSQVISIGLNLALGSYGILIK